jgi:hypothetical protein
VLADQRVSIHIIGNVVYIVYQGGCDGKVMTAFKNTVTNEVKSRACFIWWLEQEGGAEQCFKKVGKKVTRHNYHDAWERVWTGAFFGDDQVQSDCVGYGAQNFARIALEQMQMVFRNSDKKSNNAENTKASDVRFLKRGFVHDAGILWRAPLQIEVIKEMFNWKSRSVSDRDALIAALSTAFTEFYMHGKKVHTTEWKHVATKLHHVPMFDHALLAKVPEIDWNYCDHLWRSGGMTVPDYAFWNEADQAASTESVSFQGKQPPMVHNEHMHHQSGTLGWRGYEFEDEDDWDAHERWMELQKNDDWRTHTIICARGTAQDQSYVRWFMQHLSQAEIQQLIQNVPQMVAQLGVEIDEVINPQSLVEKNEGASSEDDEYSLPDSDASLYDGYDDSSELDEDLQWAYQTRAAWRRERLEPEEYAKGALVALYAESEVFTACEPLLSAIYHKEHPTKAVPRPWALLFRALDEIPNATEDEARFWFQEQIRAQSGKVEVKTDEAISETTTKRTEGILEVDETAPAVTEKVEEMEPPMPAHLPGPEAKFLMEKVFTEVIVLDSSSAVGTQFKTISHPDWAYAYSQITDVLKNAALWRGDVEVTISSDGSEFHAGSFVVALQPHWDPAWDATYMKYKTSQDLSAGSQLQCWIYHVNERRPLKITIPFAGPNDWMRTSNESQAGIGGNLYFYVMSTVRTVTATTTPKVNITISYQLKNITIQGPSLGVSTNIWPQGKQGAAGRMGAAMGGVMNEEIARSKAAMNANISRATADMAARIQSNPISRLAGVALTLPSMIGDAVALDKPSNLQMTQPFTPRAWAGLAEGAGLDSAVKLAINPTARVSAMQTKLNSAENEMQLLTLITTPFLYSYAQVTSSDAANAVIKTWTLQPLMCKQTTETISARTCYVMYNTYLSAVAQLFYAWRGGFNVMIDIDCCKSENMKLKFTIPLTGTTDDTTAANLMTKIVDVKGPTRVKFYVPFFARTTYLPVGSVTSNVSGIPSQIGTTLQMRVFTPINSMTSAVGPQAQINMWVAAAKDFKFKGFKGLDQIVGPDADLAQIYYGEQVTELPTMAVKEKKPPKYPGKQEVIKPQGLEEEDDMDVRRMFDAGFEPFIAGIQTISETGGCWADDCDNVKTLCHRYQSFAPDEGDRPDYAVHTSFTDDDTLVYNPFAWLTHMYTVWSGGMRYKFIAEGFGYFGIDACALKTVGGLTAQDSCGPMASNINMAGTTSGDTVTEFEIPYGSLRPFECVVEQYGERLILNTLANRIGPTGHGGVEWQWYAAADDWTMAWRRPGLFTIIALKPAVTKAKLDEHLRNKRRAHEERIAFKSLN